MTRVVPAQLRFVKFRDSSRYAPVKRGAFAGGIVILHDRRPDEPVELVGDAAATAAAADAAPAPAPDAAATEADASAAAASSTPQTPTGAAPMDTA
ncbi:proteasome regulatory particle base subunit [Cladochytrium tenue]|nr:proteasome regulatory particle base subunit [Cladochytrium tenue]